LRSGQELSKKGPLARPYVIQERRFGQERELAGAGTIAASLNCVKIRELLGLPG
jgi:hypothetical protein